MRILAIHFFGMYCLEREEKEKENSGLLYGLANELDVWGLEWWTYWIEVDYWNKEIHADLPFRSMRSTTGWTSD